MTGYFPDAEVLSPPVAHDRVLHLEQAVTNIMHTMESMTASLDSQVAQLANMGQFWEIWVKGVQQRTTSSIEGGA